MRYARLLVTSIIALLVMGCGSKGYKPVQLTVLTYNIHHAAGMDKKVDLQRIADVILRSDADLVALQEVDRGTMRTKGVDQAEELGRLTKMHAYFGKSMSFEGGQYGNAILSRRPIGGRRVIALPFTEGGKHEPRAAVAVRCETPAGEVLMVSTHFDHVGGPNDRLEQANALVVALESEQSAAVLAGDFNCTPQSEPVKVIEQMWTRTTDDQPSIPSIEPKTKIDHIFVRSAARWKVLETHVMDEPMASDHRPVVARLELSPAKKSASSD